MTSDRHQDSGLLRPPLLLSDRQRRLLKGFAERLRPEQRVASSEAVKVKLFGRVTDTAVITIATQVQRLIKSGDRLAAGR